MHTLGHANITVPINLIDPINVTVTPAASNLTFAGGITNNGGKSITKEGLGTLHISGAQSHANFSSLSVNQGTVILNSDAGSAALKTLGVNVTGRLTMNSSQHLASLTVNNNGNATLTAHGARTLHTRGLSLAPSAKLDLNNNDLIVDYTGSSPFSTIFNWVLQGYSESPDASKTGIISTTAQNVSGASPILALFDNALVGASDWLGNPIPNNAIVGKYTYFGDANFDGQVTGDDYTVLDANLNTDPAVGLEWLSGDMNLDGSITGDDYTVIDANLGNGIGNPLSSAQLSSVPEPAAVVLLPAGLLLTRRRRI